MNRLNRYGRRLTLATALLGAATTAMPRAAFAAVETNGRLRGNVLESQTQAPVPGAQIRVSGPQLIGNARTTATADDGTFEIFELPPGKYVVEISYAGVKPIRKNIIIRQGEAYPLDVQWSAELAEQAETVVEESRRMTRPDDSSTGTVITQDQMSRVATGRSYQDIIQQVASVTDVSGNGNPEIKGASYIQTRYIIDGLDITDPVTGTFSANINFDSIASVQVLTGAMDAEYNSLGGVINVVTAGGSDEWHASARLFINNAKFSSGNRYGSALYNGLRIADPTPKTINQGYQAVLGVSGPLIKHKLWFNLNFQYSNNQSSTVAAEPLNVSLVPDTRSTFLARLKLTWAPSDKHRITLSLSGDPEFIRNYNHDPGGLPVTEDGQNQGGALVTVLYNYFITEKQQFDISTGFQFNRIYAGPTGILGTVGHVANPYSAEANTYDPNAAKHINQDDSSSWYQGGRVQDDRRYTFQFDPSYSIRAKGGGAHDIKIGLQNRLVRWSNNSYTAGGAVYNDAGGGALEGGLCKIDPTTGNPSSGSGCSQQVIQRPSTQTGLGYAFGFFLRDRWTVLKRLILEPGIRFDYGYTRNTIGQTVSSLFGVGPRLGVIVDLTGDQKTIFKANYGRSNEVMSLLPVTNATPSGLTNTNFYNSATGKFDSPNNYTAGGGGGYRLDPSGNTPHVDSVTLSLNREIFKNSLVQIDYTYKHFANQWDSLERNQIWDPSGSRVVGHKNGVQESVFQYSRPGSNWRDYQGIDFTLESRPNDHWDIYAAYTVAWLYGPATEQFGQLSGDNFQSQYYNPRVKQFFDGFTPNDVRHILKLRASYNWKGFDIGALLAWNTGTSATHLYWNSNDGYYSTRRSPTGTDPGTTPNTVARIAQFRLPDVMNVDVRIGYSLKDLLKQDLSITFDLFNVFNLGAVTGIRQTDNPNGFGLATGRQTPFRMQLGLAYNY